MSIGAASDGSPCAVEVRVSINCGNCDAQVLSSECSGQCICSANAGKIEISRKKKRLDSCGMLVQTTEDIYNHARRTTYAYCAGSCDVYVQSTIKWRRSKRKSPRWTWILLPEGQTLPYYTKGTSRTKIRLSHIKIMVFWPLIWTVERLY